MAKPGVIIVNEFSSPGETEGGYNGYVGYMDRDSGKRGKNGEEMQTFDNYADYMGNSEKSFGLFTSTKDFLSKDEIRILKEKFKQAEDNESVMWRPLISFDNDWLQENGVYDLGKKFVNIEILRDCTRNCMKKILEKEGLEKSAIWSAAVHFNTDNIHIHTAIVEPIPMREKKMIRIIEFDNQWLRENGVVTEELKQSYYMNIDKDDVVKAKGKNRGKYVDRAVARTLWNNLVQSVEHITGERPRFGNYIQLTEQGNLQVTYLGEPGKEPFMSRLVVEKEYYKGKLSLKSLNAGKSRVVNTIVGRQKEMEMINDIIRNRMVQGIRGNSKKMLEQDDEIKSMFLDLYNSMPKDRRQWSYASNIFGPENRTKIDKLSEKILDRFFQKDMLELDAVLEKQGNNIARAYGGGNKSKQQFVDNKKVDLYKRVGNTIIKEMKTFDRMIGGRDGQRPVAKRKNKNPTRNPQKQEKYRRRDRLERELDSAMRQINRSLQKTIDNYKNLQTYQNIQNEVEYEK